MADRLTRDASSKDLSKRQERERRILDATQDLLQKWGYRKTTLEDIARKAGVTKGTIYLSWKTREALFLAVIERAEAILLIEIVERMTEDPEGMTLYGMVRHYVLATLKNPLMKALFLQDTAVLGDLITREYNTAAYQAQMQGYYVLLTLLREHGLIRNDVGLHEQTLTIASVSWGFLMIDPLLPDDFRSSDEQKVAMIVAALKRLLEPDIPPTDEQRRTGENALKVYMEQVIVATQPQENTTEMKSL